MERLPLTYPRAFLVVHMDLDELRRYYWEPEPDPGPADDDPLAMCNGEDNTIHVPFTLNSESTSDIVELIMHEIGHLYALQKYGFESLEWKEEDTAERYANKFAARWLNRLKKEGWIKKIA